jgi:long-subunit acyl-CoA synthetase (AMP-forming)
MKSLGILSGLIRYKNKKLPNKLFSTLKSLYPEISEYAKTFKYKCISEMQEKSCEMYKDKNLFGVKNGSTFDWITYKEFGKQVQCFRNVLKHHNIGKNDKVAIISNNRIEWAVTMYAAAGLGAQIVSMYEISLVF